MTKYEVGQRVHIRSVNRGFNGEGTIEKVGRTLVHVRCMWGLATYRIDTGVANDQFGHERILTDEELSAEDRRDDVMQRWRVHGLRWDHGARFSTEVMERIADLLDEETL